MTEPGQLLVTAVDGEPADSSHLNLKDLSFEIDPRAPMLLGAFLGLAWKLANDKARELGWIV